MPHPALTWVFSWLVPKEIRESLLGDLAEEYAQRAQRTSSSAALKWYVRQIFASAPPLLWARLTRGLWLSTLGVALLAYFTVGFAQVGVRWLLSNSTVPPRLDVIAIFPVVVLIGYCAERLRRRSALVLGALMLIAITLMTLTANESSPLWYRAAWFFVGPAAAYLGSVLRRVPSG